MRVLSVTAQKPCSTGSGVYLTEVVRSLAKMGVSQAVVAGVTREDRVDMPEGVTVYPVYFSSEKLPYPVVGMSDEMPYTSTRYRDMTEEMAGQFKAAFLEVLDEAIEKENPDIMAWLRFDNFDDVHISYPVLYSGDDSKYLRSDIYGNYHIAGCIFLEGLNNPDFSDYHSIIYGHNMRNTTMFGDLKRYKNDEGFYEKNQFFNVYTADKVYRYQIFSYYDVDEDSDIYTVGYGADDSWQAMIDKMVASSVKDTGIHPTKEDKVVTLSTCSKAGETKRFVVHGVLVDVKTH